MSVQAITWAIDQDIGVPAQKLLLICLANYADKTGSCWPGQKALAEDSSMTERSVRTHIKALEAAGYINREERRRADMTRTSDKYTLNIQRKNSPVEPGPTGKSASDLPEKNTPPHRKIFPGNEPVREPLVEPSARESSKALDRDEVKRVQAECERTYPGVGWRRTDPLAQERVIAEAMRDGATADALIAACRAYARENAEKPHKFDNFVRNGLWRNYAPADASPQADREGWRIKLDMWARNGRWPESWGPDPDSPNCRAPADLVAAHNAGRACA